ncbi:hypothetical protein, partial [uncultured Bilophila sp.]|uniref:hypothetical protein n=1 Tax=uncultured Bilophila sp. TaxID=529385 RepID=UPI00280C2031
HPLLFKDFCVYRIPVQSFSMLKEEALSWHMVALSQQSAEKYVLFLRFFAAWLHGWGILSGRVVNYI